MLAADRSSFSAAPRGPGAALVGDRGDEAAIMCGCPAGTIKSRVNYSKIEQIWAKTAKPFCE
jgi:hypothetical protein